MDLNGRLALVTGAGIRLGRALSEALADRGMRLALHYNQHGAQARELASRIRRERAAADSLQAECFPGDLRDPSAMHNLVAAVERSMGPLDALVLSAAIYPQEQMVEMTPESLESTLRVNMTSPFLLARAAGLRMKERGSGHIIGLLDWSLDRPYPDRVAYTMAKAGLRAGLFGLARALAPEVQVNGIAPGAVLLPEGMDAEMAERIRRATPLKRIGRPQDAAAAAVFLLESDFITGTVVTVDGGRSVA